MYTFFVEKNNHPAPINIYRRLWLTFWFWALAAAAVVAVAVLAATAVAAAALSRLWLARLGWEFNGPESGRSSTANAPPPHPGAVSKGWTTRRLRVGVGTLVFFHYYTLPIQVEVGQDARISQSTSHLRRILYNLNSTYYYMMYLCSLFRTPHLSRRTAAAHNVQYDVNNVEYFKLRQFGKSCIEWPYIFD